MSWFKDFIQSYKAIGICQDLTKIWGGKWPTYPIRILKCFQDYKKKPQLLIRDSFMTLRVSMQDHMRKLGRVWGMNLRKMTKQPLKTFYKNQGLLWIPNDKMCIWNYS